MNQPIITQENNKSSIDDQINHCLLLMKEELRNIEGPNFKRFWEVRKECLTFFKANVSPLLRPQLWEAYIALADEARMAKEHIEEDSKFASEQLDLAIDALEKELKKLQEAPEGFLSGMIATTTYPSSPKSIELHYHSYIQKQSYIQIVTIFGAKVNELRKELIKMPIRMRVKVKSFDRLSKLGDQIFPVRKQLIEELSDLFIKDIEGFADKHFPAESLDHGKLKHSLFFFREEIKQLQAFGTLLSLNSAAFTFMRKRLSLCWDHLKGMEKEVKKEFSEKKAKSAENTKVVREKIDACKEKLGAEAFSLEELATEINSIQLFMRNVELVRSDVLSLKEELLLVSAPLKDKENKEREEREAQIVEEEAAKKALFESFVAKIEQFHLSFEGREINDLLSQHVIYKKELQELRVHKGQREQVEKSLKLVLEKIHELKEKRLLSLSPEDKNALEILNAALIEKKDLRKSVKQTLENYRKKKGSQGLDVLQALELEDFIEMEKENLIKIDAIIEEIEDKISNQL